jgi:DNA-binding MarR family transcriptional regulator
MAPPTRSDEALQQAIDRIWEVIPPVWHRLRADVRSIASERFQISVQQFRLLRHIGRGIRSASELAALTGMSPPAVSQGVEALVEKGLVTRRQCAHDRRCNDLEVTPQGRETLDAIFAENRRWMVQRLASLSREDLACIVAAMRALEVAFTE